MPFYLFSGDILKCLGQNKEVSEKAGLFILWYTPGIFFMSLINIDQILLVNLEKTFHAMIC
jgi:Na+-driven multidrug efflux pump